MGISPVALESYHEKMERLTLPSSLVAYLTYAREIRELEEEKDEEAIGRMERDFGADEGVQMELDLDAMD